MDNALSNAKELRAVLEAIIALKVPFKRQTYSNSFGQLSGYINKQGGTRAAGLLEIAEDLFGLGRKEPGIFQLCI